MTEKNAYQQAGVDIKAGEQAVELMKDAVADTYTPNVLDGIGGFGAAYALGSNYKNPVLVSGVVSLMWLKKWLNVVLWAFCLVFKNKFEKNKINRVSLRS